MESPPKLPLDVLGYIADTLAAGFLYEKGRVVVKALKMLSLTCRFMVPVCRRHLFSNVKLPFSRWTFDREIEDSRNQFLLSNPTITMNYSKNLHIDVRLSELFSPSDCRLLQRICDSTSLKSLVISPIAIWDWNRLPEQTRSIILSLIQVPTLSDLSLHRIYNFPAAALSLCPGLEKIALHDILRLVPPGVNHDMQGPTITTLVSLHNYDGRTDTLAAMMSGLIVRFDRLKNASFRVRNRDDFSQVCKLLGRAISLERLEIDGPGLGVIPLAGLGLNLATNPHPKLRSMSLSLGYGDRSLYEINVELRQLIGRNVLEVLEVKGVVKEDTLFSAGPKDWAADFDQLLTDVGSFSALRRVTVDLQSCCDQAFQETGSDIDGRVWFLTEAWFPKLTENTVVDLVLCAEDLAEVLP